MSNRNKKLLTINKKSSGRNFSGKITVRSQGGREKRFLRHIDWKRNLVDLKAKVASIDYDPNRTASIALLVYANGHQDYILAPDGLRIGDILTSGDTAEIRPGNACLIKNIPIGTPVHNIELRPGKGAQIVRSAGASALIQSKEEDRVIVKLPSGQLRIIHPSAKATIGVVSNLDHKNEIIGSAGRHRHMGVRPTVRGVAQDPRSHPHGGGEGRSGIGMKSPKTPWGKRVTKKTRSHKKYSNRLIIKANQASKQ